MKKILFYTTLIICSTFHSQDDWTYYTVKGNFETPEILPIPFTSLGKKVMGIFQGVLETPVEILESLPVIEPSVPSSKEDDPFSTEGDE